jgi:hypothetical protein
MSTVPVQLGAVGILLFFVVGVGVAIYKGFLVPRRTVDDIRADRDARIAELVAEADEWRKAWQADHDLVVKMSGQMDTLLSAAQGSSAALQSLTWEARQRR